MSGTEEQDRRQLKGRGALTNRGGRFETLLSVKVDDGWGIDQRNDREKTTLIDDSARSIIAWNQSPDIPFDRSVNPYRGCEHGCIYCFARPSHTYLGYSAGLDFETKLLVKRNAAKLLENELSKEGYRCDTIALSPNTDCYQPVERELQLTRQILVVAQRFKHPISIITKSKLVQRDIDILADMAKDNLVNVIISVTTLDPHLSQNLEPRASAPHRRLQTLQKLSEAGIPTGVLVAPIIPFINDHEIEGILQNCKDAGASSAGYVLLRLPLEVRDLWLEWLETHYPDRAQRVMKIIKLSRNGKDYEAAFGQRMTGTGDYARLLSKRFQLATRRLQLSPRSTRLNTSLFDVPGKSTQLDLF